MSINGSPDGKSGKTFSYILLFREEWEVRLKRGRYFHGMVTGAATIQVRKEQ